MGLGRKRFREFYLIFGAKFENEMYTRFCEENKWD